MKILTKILYYFVCPILIFPQTKVDINNQLLQVSKYISENNYTQGLSSLNALLQQNPNDHDIYRFYAQLFLQLNHYPSALSNIQKALLLSKENASNHLVAGNIYQAQKNYPEAHKSYTKAISLDPSMGEAYTAFSLLNLQHNFIQDAQRLAELAYHYNTESWQSIILQAKIAQKSNKSAQAQKIFLDGIRNFPYNEQLLDAFAEFYITNKELSKAIVILEEANARFGDSIQRNQLLGDITFSQQQKEKALKYYEFLDNIYAQLSLPPSALLKWRLYNLYKDLNIEKAYPFLQNALELSPTNQLYISAFYGSLLSNDTSPLKSSLVRHLDTLVNQEQKTGINYYYLSLLQKILLLNPAHNKARQQLTTYAKLQQNEAQIQEFLTQSLTYEPNNISLQNTLLLRNHLDKTKRLNNKIRPVYQYTNKIFVEDNICFFGSSIERELQNLELFFPNIHNTIELTKQFAQESRTIFQTNTNYNIVSHLSINPQDSTMNIRIFDKQGFPIDTFQHQFQTETLTKTLISFTQYLNTLLPPIGYITTRQTNSHFQISLGSKNHILSNSTMAILDKNFKVLTTAQITELSPYSAIIKQLSTPMQAIDIESAYVVPLQYVPTLNTNQTSTNIIKDINQVSQPRYSTQINLSPPN
ncbi:MAG: tetratricopeptide repeat protein [Brevinema sp.]